MHARAGVLHERGLLVERAVLGQRIDLDEAATVVGLEHVATTPIHAHVARAAALRFLEVEQA
jgi:hypothetical protein